MFSHDIRSFTDASNIGFEAIYELYSWIQSGWDKCMREYSIDFKELFAAAKTWCSSWVGKRIVFVTDNLPITQVWNIGSTKSQELMPFVRKLFLIAAKGGSGFQVARLRQLMPQANLQPTPIPESVWTDHTTLKS